MTGQISQRRGGSKEIHTGDLKVGQQPKIILDDNPIDHEQIIVPVDGPMGMNQVEMLAFAEEPITIRITPSNEKNAPVVVDCWVNGKGAEVFVNGKWFEFGCIPVARAVITKRKYVEVLARSKVDNVSTRTGSTNDEKPENSIDRSTSSKTTFSVLHDKNPAGAEWLTRLLMEG